MTFLTVMHLDIQVEDPYSSVANPGPRTVHSVPLNAAPETGGLAAASLQPCIGFE